MKPTEEGEVSELDSAPRLPWLLGENQMTLTETQKLTAEITARLLCSYPEKFLGPIDNQIILAVDLAKNIIEHSVLANSNT